MSERTPREAGPAVAQSVGSTLANRTGSWKYIRPEYRDRLAPCNEACPAGIDVQGYMLLLQQGRLQPALKLLLRDNPIPAVTGRACDHPCESGCNRRQFDEAVSIREVERMLGDLDLSAPAPEALPRRYGERVAVVGSGPAGLSCAYQLNAFGYEVVVLEEAAEPGGMLRLGIPAYRLPRPVLDRQIQRFRDLGIEFRCGVKPGDELEWNALDEFAAVFLATGAHVGRKLGVPDEQMPDVGSGLDFLKMVNRGEWPELGRRVVIVGGGNTAMDCARTALRLGSRPVVMYRRTWAEMPAIREEVRQAEREGVEFIFLAAPAAFLARRGSLVGVECVRMRLGEPDASGRRRPVPAEEGRFTLLADSVLTATGEDPEMSALPPELQQEAWGVEAGPFGGTAAARFFAGGDLAGADRTVAHALGSGKRAALGIHQYLRQAAGEVVEVPPLEELSAGGRGNIDMTRFLGDCPVRRTSPSNEVVQFDELQPAHFVVAPRYRVAALPALEARKSFDEINCGLNRANALAEAARCFTCGLCNDCEICLIFCPDVAITRAESGAGFRIDLDYCKGCGLCAAECPRGAITMVPERR